MTNSKHTKRALLSSVIALILCCSMLVGTTFAWFTDSVESVNNIITAGNLDIEVTNAKGDISGQATLFQDILWEPGVVAYENLTVKNVGTLALKYAMYINFEGQNFVIEADGTQTNYGLASKLEVAIVPGGVNLDDSNVREDVVAEGNKYGWTALENLVQPGKLYPKDNKAGEKVEETFAIVIRWNPASDDNNWNVQNGKTTTDGKPLHIDLGVNLVATQLTYESDSFDHLYDEQAKFDILPQASVSNKNPEGLETIIYDVNTGSFDMNTIVTLNLDTAYAFKGESPETAAQNKYADWFVDFFVAVDKDPKAGLMLSGQYDSFFDKWVAFEVPADAIKANTFYPLLGSVTGGGVSNWTYVDICQGVGTFNCGAVDTQGLNAGTTMTVQLRLINPENTDETIVARETTYTFSKAVSNADELAVAIESGVSNITLTGDMEFTGENMITVPTGANVTVNLNGHDITADFAAKTDGASAIFTVGKNASLTITGEGDVHATAAPTLSYVSSIFTNLGTLTINGGNYSMTYGSYAEGYLIPTIVDTNSNIGKATTTINGGTFTHTRNMFRNFAQAQRGENNATLIINGGTFNGQADDYATIWNQKTSANGVEGDGIVIVNGGTFNYVNVDNEFETGVTIADGLNLQIVN